MRDYVDYLEKSSLSESAASLFRDVVDWHQKPPLMITGVGGIGKSTLVAKFILDHVDDRSNLTALPFVYLDFDIPGLSVAKPATILLEALRQLNCQQIISDEALEILTPQVELYFSDVKSGESDRVNFFAFVKERFKELAHNKKPVLVVLDSFEEVQYRVSVPVLQKFFNLISEISKELLPRLRTVFAGRSTIKIPSVNFTPLTIETFDEESCKAYLHGKGIEPNAAKLIFKLFGGNLLTIKLAAELVLRRGSKGSAILEKIDTGTIFTKRDQNQIQEELVKRNLDHIHDEEVRKIAIPGILVRSLSPEVISKVLAGPCGLGTIKPSRAKELFAQLKKETFLISEMKGVTAFRQDLRVALCPIISGEKKYRAKDIHANAISYYKGKKEDRYKAELLYHSLMLEGNPDLIDKFYEPSMHPFLENSFREFPPAVFLRFANLHNLSVSDETLQKGKPIDIDAYLKKQIIEVLSIGEERQLIDLKKLLSKFKARYNSSLLYYEARLRMRLSEFSEAKNIIDGALKQSKTGVEYIRLKLLLIDVLERESQFSHAFAQVSEIDPAKYLGRVISAKNATEEDLRLLYSVQIEWYMTVLRLVKRMDKEQFPKGLNLGTVIQRIVDVNNLSQKTFPKAQQFEIFPQPYRMIIQRKLKRPIRSLSAKHIEQALLELYNSFWPVKKFVNEQKNWKETFRSTIHMNEELKMGYGIMLKDFAEPGNLQACIQDFLRFIEAAPRSHPRYDIKS
jgi:hypothetical protein